MVERMMMTTIDDGAISALMEHIAHLRSHLTSIAERREEPRSAEDARNALAQSLRAPS